jgi:plasmid stabilization system protein ParE
MTYRVELTTRASRDLRHIFKTIAAADSVQAKHWFNGLEEAVLSLKRHPARGMATPEDCGLRQLLYGSDRYIYRIIYTIDEGNRRVIVIHVRHGSRRPMVPNPR